MNKLFSCLLMLVFLAPCFMLAVMPAVAQKQNSVPSTVEEIEEVAREVLVFDVTKHAVFVYPAWKGVEP